jgi:CRISPR system Cascade subunit CasA
MSFNVLTEPFFPVITRKGGRRWVSFPELAQVEGEDAPVDFDWPRADFNIASYEFAIGVATLAFQPTKPGQWLKLWAASPTPDQAHAALAPFVHAFVLDGQGPRFMQELGGLEGEMKPIEALLINTPGENGQNKNADLLTHRDRYPALGLPAAAMALYTLQQFAPSGGAGNRTSMRGGGPMTTLATIESASTRAPLWRNILANVVNDQANEYDEDDLLKILPWLAPTLVSDKASGERKVHQSDPDAHPLQSYFGMPRRIGLRFGGKGRCPMTGLVGPLVGGFVQKPWGVNYGIWTHPLTPYRRQKEGAEPFSVKPKSARFGYRDWTAVIVGEERGQLACPSRNIGSARSERRAQFSEAADAKAQLRAAGWAMNNMEAVAYLDATQPLHIASIEKAQRALDRAARQYAEAAERAVAMLVFALRSALFAEHAKPSTDTGLFADARAAFFEATENDFHAALDSWLATPDQPHEAAARHWLACMRRAEFTVFETAAAIPITDVERSRRVADAFGRLSAGFAGYGRLGTQLFETLGLPPAEIKVGKGRKADGEKL